MACIGDRIKAVRNAKRLNQRDFSKMLGISSGHISEIESGKKMPGSDIILSLKRELFVDLNWLEDGNGEMFLPFDERLEEIKNKAATGAVLTGEDARPGHALNDKAKGATVAHLIDGELLDQVVDVLLSDSSEFRGLGVKQITPEIIELYNRVVDEPLNRRRLRLEFICCCRSQGAIMVAMETMRQLDFGNVEEGLAAAQKRLDELKARELELEKQLSELS